MSFSKKFFGSPSIEELKAKHDVEALVTLLAHKDLITVQKAAIALGEIGDDSVIQSLTELLKNKDAENNVRQAAAQALGKAGSHEAILILIEALRTGHTKDIAIEALKQTGEPASKALVPFLKDPIREKIAIEALVKIGSPSIKPLTAALHHENYSVRKNAVAILGELGGSEVVDTLIAALQDEQVGLRTRIVEALVQIGDAHAIEPLVSVVEDGDTYARLLVAEFLATKSDERAFKLAVDALRVESAQTRGRAAKVIDKIGLSSDIDVDTQAWYVVAKREWSAATSLGGSAVEPLINALNDAQTAIAAKESLAKMGSAAVEKLIPLLKSGSMVAPQLLGQIGDKRAVEPLIEALENKTHAQKTSSLITGTAEAMGKSIDDKDALARAAGALSSMSQRHEAERIEAILKALNAITGQNFGLDTDRWRQWWESEKGRAS